MDSQVVTILATFPLDLTKSHCGIPYFFPRKQVSLKMYQIHSHHKNYLTAWIVSNWCISQKFGWEWNFVWCQKIVPKHQWKLQEICFARMSLDIFTIFDPFGIIDYISKFSIWRYWCCHNHRICHFSRSLHDFELVYESEEKIWHQSCNQRIQPNFDGQKNMGRVE